MTTSGNWCWVGVDGLTQNIDTFEPTEVAFHEYKAIARDARGARSWRERWGYMLRGPGWAPQER